MTGGSSPLFQDFFHNQVLVCSFFSWLSAQMTKYVIDGIRYRTWGAGNLLSSGGMPSSHTAAVVALTFAVGFQEGFGSAVFAVSAVFSLVVMSDAIGVRRETGRQGSVLNWMLDTVRDWLEEMQKKPEELNVQDLKERVGHSPLEVLAGFIWGLVFALLFRSA